MFFRFRQHSRGPLLRRRTHPVVRREPHRDGKLSLRAGLIAVQRLRQLPRPSHLQRRLLFGQRQRTPFLHLCLNRRQHGLQALGILARHRQHARRPFRVQVERRGPVSHLVALARHIEAGAAHLLLGLRDRVTLLAIEQELRRVRLHNARRRAFNAHRKPVAVREAAAHGHSRRERVFGNLHRVPRVYFVQPRQRDIGILRHRPPHRLTQRHGMNLGMHAETQGNTKEDRSIDHPLIVSRPSTPR